jgi:transcriptional regulator with PAS, ATPase and Fis domain
LKEKVRLGEFREDLYYRLKVVEVALPPLHKRLEDIPLLVEYFCNAFNKNFQKNIQGLSDEFLNIFMNYHWPGNVRELEHCIEHAFVICRDPIISRNHIPAEIREYSAISDSIQVKRTVEGPQILKALDKTDWNKAKAARLLGIDRSTLYRKIHKYGLSRPAEKV